MHKKTEQADSWLLIANGAPLVKTKLFALAENKRIIVLDGAYQYVSTLDLEIDILLGDFDSLESDLLRQAERSNIQIVHTPNQNQTDFEKGIYYLDSIGAESIFTCAATGLRLQHTLYNLRMLKKFYQPERAITLLTATENIRYLQNETFTLRGAIGDSVGLLGFPYATITTSGLEYDMADYALTFAQQASVCNALIQEEATLQITGEALCIHETYLINP